ncbi:Stk1 family PASTA domain-containing Ser/Thr kinase [Brachybacterium phenoliresistens]|uniref:non-specific serine/threonine protein kinase n=1 Tax=Brachybacterium phenoliresistens TaxID=396014 RepID=Z9JYM1_9MICO|nr:Stk1 family PASTA domain-containing Ser/Thr kinase [Brachybacterium phenoliresistens]EWS82892.1 serine/threonine protein kinase [Brachybacterium phenoliresistens]
MSAQPTTSPDTGMLLDGRYRVGELVARGGMASVHRGHDQRLDRSVALKIMHPHLAVDEEFRRRFAREARSVARLAHRHVVGVFDQGEDGDRIYLAMELVEGGTLRNRISRQGQLTVRDALEVTGAVLEALSAAHRAGIVHRDIKPENILLSDDGQVKVADFGLARLIGTAASSATGTLLGTVAYVSPEVVTRGVSDERSDLYSLGVVLYEMLVGTQPYTGEAAVHIAFQHVHEDIPAPSLRAPHVPQGVDSLVTWCCARTPSSRPASAEEALESVRDLLRTVPDSVLDAAPLTAERVHTQDLPHLTASLDEVDLAQDGAVRSFPEGLAARAQRSLGDAEPGADGEAAAGAPAGRDPDGPDDADLGAVDLHVPLPRVPDGRHLAVPRRGPSPAVRILGLAAVLALLAGAGLAGWRWYATAGPGGDRVVPVLQGEQLADAEAELASRDLGTRTQEQFSDSVPAGEIISASPEPGAVIKRDTPVTIIVSTGPQTFAVPDVTGQDLETATAALEDAGFVLAQGEPAYSEDVPEGSVISQSTPGDAEALPAGGVVTVVLSQGREPIPVADQRGKGYDTATAQLEDAGLQVTTSWAFSATVPRGAIISQDPVGGTLHRGDTVSLVISKGQELVTVPAVTGSTEAEARAALEAAGLQVVVSKPAGTPATALVSAQSEVEGTRLAKGSTVTITLP